MARHPRGDTVTKDGGVFHVYNRVAGALNFLPFMNEKVRQMFFEMLKKSLERSFIQAAACTLMGNHFHLILSVPKVRKLKRETLHKYAEIRWGKHWQRETRYWTDQRWWQFNEDLFSLDCFMRDFEGPFARWYNRQHNERGPFWERRFKANLLEGQRALLECLFYIELNPVRANLCRRPELWAAGSAKARFDKTDDWLIPLKKLFKGWGLGGPWKAYRAGLLYRGERVREEGQGVIPQEMVTEEEARGFCRPGMYLESHGFMLDGLVISSRRLIKKQLKRLKKKGRYKKRRDPLCHFNGLLYSVREPRRA